jgi:hypothetical protein
MPETSTDYGALVDEFERSGFLIVPGLLSESRVAALIEATRAYASAGHDGALDRRGEVYGGRDLLWRVPEIFDLSRSPEIVGPIQAILGQSAFPVRGLFFDKTLTTNWSLPWHQDLTIAVKERREVPGFGPWTRKAGIHHTHAPAELLARMLTIRLHLDEQGPGDGPLRVLPGSHRPGKLSAPALASWTTRARDLAVDCVLPAGGAVIMRPLLVHSSASRTAPGRRRVIHLEFAAETLPGGLEWYQPLDQVKQMHAPARVR